MPRLTRLTRSIPHSASTEPSTPEQDIFTHGLAEAISRDSDNPRLRQDRLERSPSPNYPYFLQHTDSDSSDDDAVDIPYRNDEDRTGVRVGVTTRRTKPSADEQDPGPSVRDRTTAELNAAMEAQVEDPSFPGLDTTGLPLLRNFMTACERNLVGMHPKRTELDWRRGVRRPVRSGRPRCAAQGQLCGVEAPADQECISCAKGQRTFEHCRIVFVKNEAQWGWACANCAFVSSGSKCSFRPDLVSPNVPSWVIAAVTERQPSSLLLHTYCGAKDTDAARKSTKPTVGRKRPGTTPDDAGEENPPKSRKFKVGPVNPSEGAAKDAPPKLKNGGLPFNATWYNSPLEDPEVYRMKDKAYALGTYRDLGDIIARAAEDQARTKAAMIKKGFPLE